jgi:ppGpp synthetase/RelA/SpoT-type nucleotidyltranferase
LVKLGERLRAGPLTLDDLRQLRAFLETLEPFAEETFARIRDLEREAAGLRLAQVTRRNIKTTRSIVAKLRRQTTKLVQIQDLVGCRIVVADPVDQNEWLTALGRVFPSAQTVDRRLNPQHGYRALHLIERVGNQRFEIQLRTRLQDQWANYVEKFDDRFRMGLKYGLGEVNVLNQLERASKSIANVEDFQRRFEVSAAGGRGAAVIATYVGDYQKAVGAAWPAIEGRAKVRWQAALRRALELGHRWPRNDARNFFELSREYRDAWEEAEAYAAHLLRLVLWSSVELPAGTEFAIGKNGDPWPLPTYMLSSLPLVEAPRAEPGRPQGIVNTEEREGGIANVILVKTFRPWQKEASSPLGGRIVILRENATVSDATVAPTFGDLHQGHIYEITQPKHPELYFTHREGFDDLVSDVQSDFLNLERLLE